MNRRDSLRILAGAIWAAGLTRAVAHGASASELEEKLKRDVERLAPRVYSDEGIPVFLACVDLHRPAKKPAVLTHFNAELARQMRDNAAAWERLYPEAKPEDISKLIEILADRDFNALQAGAHS